LLLKINRGRFSCGQGRVADPNPMQNTTLPTAQQNNVGKSLASILYRKNYKMATRYLPPLFCFGLTHAPKKAVGLDREDIDKFHLTFTSRWGLTGQISLIGQCVGRQPLHATGGFAQAGFTSRGQF